MKAFLLSSLALLALCGVVIWNGFYISNVTRDLSECVNRISTLNDENELDELEKIWESSKIWISISVPHKESDEFEKSLILLRAKFENEISTEFDETVALVKRSIEEIKVHGTVSIDNVF